MFSKIIGFSIRNKLAIGIMTLILVTWGIWSATRLPVDAVPDITNNQVQIITLSPQLASQEVEQLITFPIEQSIANLPDLIEVRSISRFGLSVITVVFEESVDIYFARQLLTERLKEAEEQIPEGMGKPELAPVSTGLGQIYEYVLHPVKGAEGKYSPMELRTMQDWIVARQLYGTPGVAEVNSFGGKLKQYEVSVNPFRLNAMNVSIPEIVEALEKNNANTGGAYIEKNPNAYYIRGTGMVKSLDDIGRIVVKTENGIPLLIRDVAELRFGHAVRYGALTWNGEGEVVGGVVMMLKGANSAEVVKRVKEKMLMIGKSLPADIEIVPYLDRTSLVERAISTVEINLTEGALIVIFVLVIFLGNLRAGLIVASAIPLSLLFALGMMNVFGVSANLMSLGAIDFGLIVDGAVIIVEATLHYLRTGKHNRKLTQGEMDTAVGYSAGRMMNSAAFGQIIILIVYLPILTLEGVEGKMFRPMAQTVSFAILGALILSLTYIPMMSALFLSKKQVHKENFSDRMIRFFHRLYAPVLNAAIRFRYLVVGSALALTVITAIVFSRMGGEFIPQLQEGDYAFHCILPQGSSLSQSLETSKKAARIIKQFPEVKIVVGKTGSAEVPTDPMPPEGTDLIIVLKDKSEWTTTKDYDELASLMLEELSAIPGVFFESNQPIQMRFNELMTGVRQDVAVKIFGENIDSLAAIAPQVAAVIETVEGATEPQVERVVGLPQITIDYDRSRIAGYGLTIDDVNQVVSSAFAGRVAGVVYEDEKKFDLVVRLDSAYRRSIDDVAALYVPLGNGAQIPLSQLAKVEFREGPAQISRENARRRIVVGFNVEGRDVQSVVEEIQEKLASFKLPTGYYFTYGGTFENLQAATARMRIAVPAALLLIFILLYFTFHSVKQAALIFTAIPMAAIGGVFMLLLRDMPFSISAGVGFIALFGVAVLNGIVLISTFNQLQKEGWNDVVERIREGTRIRLRPVLMTATVASLGFLPMAISQGAGAEVQKPLASVVIGGLITATILTLIVLPLLYLIFSGKRTKPVNMMKPAMIVGLILLSGTAFTQTIPTQRVSINAAIDSAYNNNPTLKAAKLQAERGRTLVNTASDIPKTGIFVENEDFNPYDKNGILKIGISQSFEWPGVYRARRELLQLQSGALESQLSITEANLRTSILQAYYRLGYLEARRVLLIRMDSIFRSLTKAAVLRVKTGESAGLDSIAASARSGETAVQVAMLEKEIRAAAEQLRGLLNTRTTLYPQTFSKFSFTADSIPEDHPLLALQQQLVSAAIAEQNLQKQMRKPEFQGRVYSQRLYGMKDPFTGFSVTVGIPIFGGKAYRSRLRAAEIETNYRVTNLEKEKLELITRYRATYQDLEKEVELLSFYETKGLNQAEQIINAASLAYRGGEISFAELSQYLSQAMEIRRNYLEALNRYNQSAIQLSYYLNQ